MINFVGWMMAASITCTMFVLAYGKVASDDVKEVKRFESSMVSQNSRIVGKDLFGGKESTV